MIAKASWFSPRKYSGWGLTPNCWQGWLYIVIATLPFIFIPNLPIDSNIRMYLTYFWGALFFFDLIQVFLHIKKDERETLHEALAERNALWTIVTVLTLTFIYQSSINQPDYFILIAILASLIVKSLTHYLLRHR